MFLTKLYKILPFSKQLNYLKKSPFAVCSMPITFLQEVICFRSAGFIAGAQSDFGLNRHPKTLYYLRIFTRIFSA